MENKEIYKTKVFMTYNGVVISYNIETYYKIENTESQDVELINGQLIHIFKDMPHMRRIKANEEWFTKTNIYTFNQPK